MFALLPARSIVPMFGGSFALIGKRLSEVPCREGQFSYTLFSVPITTNFERGFLAWQKMEDELSITRPTFDYVPEKYIKIKVSNRRITKFR